MKRLFATTALAVIVASSAAMASDAERVIILQKFDMKKFEVQDVNNYIGAKTDITDSSLEGTNIQNLLQWRDVSEDLDYGDIYEFKQVTTFEEQLVNNTAISTYGGVGADLSATNIMNLMELEDVIGGAGHVGDHQLLEQYALGSKQFGVNTILAKGAIADSSASITNLANVADITGKGGGSVYGDILRLDQYAVYTKQYANNWAAGGSVDGLTMDAVNGVNIASFDLSDMTGAGDLAITQKTYNVTQDINNGVQAHGSVAGAALSGTNLGNVISFAVEIQE
jgi:hypothetical protein